jgi:hypothetical protein
VAKTQYNETDGFGETDCWISPGMPYRDAIPGSRTNFHVR